MAEKLKCFTNDAGISVKKLEEKNVERSYQEDWLNWVSRQVAVVLVRVHKTKHAGR